MSIAILTIREQPGYRRQAFEQGLKRIGCTIVGDGYGRRMPSGPGDLLVLWNLRRGVDEVYARRWEQAGGTVIVCENGYLQREDKTRYAISTHGHNGSGWFPVGDDKRFPLLGFELKPWREGGDYVLVRDQRSIGSQLMHSPPGWGPKMVDQLRKLTKLPVRLMPHPGDKGKLEADAANLARAATVVIWCSAIGVRALVEGIDVVSVAPHWVCQQAAARQWSHAGEQVYRAEREAALEHMAHGQWHYEEIASGEPFARMAAQGWGPRWH